MAERRDRPQPAPASFQPGQLPEINLDGDRALGELVAEAKITATQEAFDQTYLAGVENFWEQRGISPADKDLGEAIAEALLEERRKTLIQIVTRTCCYAVPAALCGFLIGLKPELAIATAVPVGGAIAAYQTKD